MHLRINKKVADVVLDNIVKKLMSYDGVRITEKDLRDVISNQEYEEYFFIVMQLIEKGILLPVKNSGPNGMRPPLYKRYTIIKKQVDYKDLIQQIRLLNNKLNIEGYLSNPEKFQHHKIWLQPIDNYLKNNFKCLETQVSINERSFQIFRKEKALKDDKELAGVINFNLGLREILNYYYTPEPFFMFNITRWETDKSDMIVGILSCSDGVKVQVVEDGIDLEELSSKRRQINVLIIENKDTWYTLKKALNERQNHLCRVAFDVLLYGEGKKISRKNDSLSDFDRSFFNYYRTSYFYFGDLDYEGISIFNDLKNTNPELDIHLMRDLYINMLEASKGNDMPSAKVNQNQKALKWFLSLFDDVHQSMILSILEAGKYIPQEILNYGDYMRICGRGKNV